MRDERLVPDEGRQNSYYIRLTTEEGETYEFETYCYEHELSDIVAEEGEDVFGHGDFTVHIEDGELY